jgi:hypothetical protein
VAKELKLEHEPALKEDGEVYRPWMFDDTGELTGFQGHLCRHCHSYYADPKTAPNKNGKKWDAKLEGTNVCPAKLLELLKATIL